MTTPSPTQRAFRHVFTGLFALAASAVTVSALADTASRASDSVPTLVVRYGDLDLTTDTGSTLLYQRIVSAARQVCPDPFARDLATVAASQKCQAAAIEKAVQDVHSPMLAQVYAARTRPAVTRTRHG